MEDKALVIFENFKIRRHYDETKEKWYFSVVDIIQALTEQSDFQKARKYWNKLKERLKEEGSELVTNCHQLKMVAEDGKMRDTDVADVETLLRLVQSVPSPKAEPIKLWLAKVGYERMQEMMNPEKSIDRARENWKKYGRSEKWIKRLYHNSYFGCKFDILVLTVSSSPYIINHIMLGFSSLSKHKISNFRFKTEL
jgi:DNA-damage-inducible protein D